MPTTRAASAPSRSAIRKEEITGRVPVANQLQVTKTSLVPINHAVKAFCLCHALSRQLQYALMFAFQGSRRVPPHGKRRLEKGRLRVALLVIIASFLSVSVRAQSSNVVPGAPDSVVPSS